MSGTSPLPSRDRRLAASGALVLRGLLPALDATWRFEIRGAGELERRLASGEPAIYVFWHEHLLPCGWWLHRRHRAGGRRLTVFASHSRDGELVARTALPLGLGVVRGSTSRGGLAGLRRLHRAVAGGRGGEPSSVMLAPDGPRGPARRCQEGVVALAQTTGAPLVPLTFRPESAWRLRSWDRMVVPKPWARGVLEVGEPYRVPREVPAGELADHAGEVERRLGPGERVATRES